MPPAVLSRVLAPDAGRVLPAAEVRSEPPSEETAGAEGCSHTTARTGMPAATAADSPADVLGSPSTQ